MWSGIDLLKRNSAPFGQIWTLLCKCLFQTVHLQTVQMRIVDNSLPIPPNPQQKHCGRSSWIGDCFCRLTAIRRSPFSFAVSISDPLFDTSHRSLIFQLKTHSYIELLCLSSTQCLASGQSKQCFYGAQMPLFIDIFENRRALFTRKLTRPRENYVVSTMVCATGKLPLPITSAWRSIFLIASSEGINELSVS